MWSDQTVQNFTQSSLHTGWKNLKMKTAKAPWIIGSNAWLSLQGKKISPFWVRTSPDSTYLSSSHHTPAHLWRTWLHLLEDLLIGIGKLLLHPPKLSLLQAKQAQFSQCLLKSYVLQFPVILVALCWHQHLLASFLHQNTGHSIKHVVQEMWSKEEQSLCLIFWLCSCSHRPGCC